MLYWSFGSSSISCISHCVRLKQHQRASREAYNLSQHVFVQLAEKKRNYYSACLYTRVHNINFPFYQVILSVVYNLIWCMFLYGVLSYQIHSIWLRTVGLSCVLLASPLSKDNLLFSYYLFAFWNKENKINLLFY